MYSPIPQPTQAPSPTRVHKQLFDEHYRSLFLYGLKLCKNQEQVTSAMQKVFVNIWNENILDESTLPTRVDLLREVRYFLLQPLKRKKNKALVFRLSSADFEIHPLKSYKRAKDLADALNNLSSEHREILYLKRFSQLASNEIATITSLSTDHIDQLFLECMLTVRQCLT